MVAIPLTDLTEKSLPDRVKWTTGCEAALVTLKKSTLWGATQIPAESSSFRRMPWTERCSIKQEMTTWNGLWLTLAGSILLSKGVFGHQIKCGSVFSGGTENMRLYSFTILHQAGSKNSNADAFLRGPIQLSGGGQPQEKGEGVQQSDRLTLQLLLSYLTQILNLIGGCHSYSKPPALTPSQQIFQTPCFDSQLFGWSHYPCTLWLVSHKKWLHYFALYQLHSQALWRTWE